MNFVKNIPFLILAFFCSTFLLAGQTAIPRVYANSDETYFVEGDRDAKHNWYLDPSIKLDVYETDKFDGVKEIKFYTDIDSLKFNLSAGEQFDFYVILNGKDSCLNRVIVPKPITEFAEQLPVSRDTIPFELSNANNILFKTVLNGIDTLVLHFDTGGSGIVLTHDAIKNKTNLLEENSEDKTQDYNPLDDKSSIQLGNLKWEEQTIYPVSIGPKGTDGHFSWNLFDGRVVELDYDKSIMVVHSSMSEIPKGYARLEIEYINGLFCIEGRLKAGKKKLTNRYLFDTGYQRAILLDSDLNKSDDFPMDLPTIKESKLTNGQGHEFITKVVNSKFLKLGKAKAKNITTQLIEIPNPARFKTHILGNELLKRFNTIFDFQNNYVYLKANALMDVKYIDAS